MIGARGSLVLPDPMLEGPCCHERMTARALEHRMSREEAALAPIRPQLACDRVRHMLSVQLTKAVRCLTIALLSSACSNSVPTPNVILIIGDTLRADRLGTYGNERGLTPYLDDFGEEGVVFESASSHAPWTLPSTASILTSLYPRQHGAGGFLGQFRKLDPNVRTMAEQFRDRGYATHAIVNVDFLGERFGLTRGFDSVDFEAYQSNVEVRIAQRTTSAALEWIEQQDTKQPWFLLVHYFDPHAVYDPPQPFRGRFAAPLDQDDDSWVFGTREHMIALRQGKLQLTPPVIKRAEKLYDAEVAYLDAEIGRLLDGVGPEAIACFTSDHGEEFLEHNGFEHGHTLYPELTHVPLILRAPGLGPARVSQSVGHVDIAPSLFELANIPGIPDSIGASLVEFVETPSAAGRPILAHGNFWGAPLTSWRSGEWILILQGKIRSAPELYAWRDDRELLQNVATQNPAVVTRLRNELTALEKRARELRGEDVDLSPEERSALKGLGYGGGAAEDE
ncbi:MAG: choline-sulfatase [Planctomycetota bacterium]|jgi:choline-sulfatase